MSVGHFDVGIAWERSDDADRPFRQLGAEVVPHSRHDRFAADKEVHDRRLRSGWVTVDNKTTMRSNRSTGNYTVEMRSLLGNLRCVREHGVRGYFACTQGVISAEVLEDAVWHPGRTNFTEHIEACCLPCKRLLIREGLSAEDALPEYCPRLLASRGPDRSATPYLLFPLSWCEPYEVIYRCCDFCPYTLHRILAASGQTQHMSCTSATRCLGG